MDYLISQFKRKHKADISQDKRALQRIRRECEKAKRALSVQTQTTIEVTASRRGPLAPGAVPS
jgi:molecular chaperone DnaK (HSP70)